MEHGDQPRGDLAEGLDRVGAERRQRGKPLVPGAALVEVALLHVGGLADAPFRGRIGDGDEVPGLLVGYAGRARPRVAGLIAVMRARPPGD